MIHVGDYVYFRTSVTQRKAAGEVKYINYPHGWVTVEVTLPKGKYREAVAISELEGFAPKGQRRVVDPKTLWTDTADDWLSEWDEEKIDAEVRKMRDKGFKK